MSELHMVLGAIQALYGSEGPVRQREANEFLIEFARTDAAWRVGLQILCDATLASSMEALFFAANMIHAKARKEWTKLSEEEKQSMTQMIQALLQEVQNGSRPGLQHPPLQSKLCGIFAIAMCSMPDQCRALLDSLIVEASNHTATSMSVLGFFVTFARCVCEEMSEAELRFAAKDAMEMHLVSLSDDVVRVLSEVILSIDASQSSTVQGEALHCLKVWMKQAGTSLTRLYSHQPMMLRALIDTLGQLSNHVPICVEILCQIFKVAAYPTAALQDEALRITASQLLTLRTAYESALAAEEEELAHAITDVIATFCETYADWIVEGEAPESLALGELMLVLGTHPRRQIASLTLEFWLLVQEEPVADRHPFFQREAFVRLLDGLLQQCTYPSDTDDMDEFELDDLTAYRSGSQGVSDVLIAIFALLREQFVAQVLHRIGTGEDWRLVEVCLFAVSNVADDLKKRLVSDSPVGKALEPFALQVLEIVFRSTSHALVVTTGAKLLGQLGAWLNRKALDSGSVDAISSVLQYLNQAMTAPASRTNAAKSFMQVTTSCSQCLVDLSPVFLTAVVQQFASRQMEITDRLLVVEGLARVAALSSQSFAILQALLDDALGHMDQVLAAQDVREDVLVQVVAEELQVCGKVVRFLDAPSEVAGSLGLTKWVVETIWPHLELVSTRLSAHEAVMNALFELHGWCLRSLREEMAPQLPLVATLIVSVFEQHFFVSSLECASIAVDVFGRTAEQDAAVLESFRGLMGMLSRVAFQFFTSRGVGDAPDLLRAFYELGYRFLLYCPAAVVTASEFPVLLDLSRACVGNQDRVSTNAVVVFVSYLLTESRGKLQRFQGEIDRFVWGDATVLEQWLDTVLSALASQSPSVLYDTLGRLWLALWVPAFEQYGVLVATLVAQSLASKSERLGCQELSPAERERVPQLWFQYAKEPTRYAERKFRSLCGDFAKICRKELTADALESYEES
ncbi:hypothetical protein Poli38472_010239 [Pythium oligandrum]|uniref:Exportin-1/Importin-beta-like domain-containing protein n=1 Tax=Pythium oligandrum TaxID=41045 RepID=A0A8K1FCT5_PYTOL|nr:hypothetical protein Poli38472_010239 [Pythium oligandrum]|eukprot:TMW58680.1 hypothetical protein Poli38472_010239 [Pythium oligandrum]